MSSLSMSNLKLVLKIHTNMHTHTTRSFYANKILPKKSKVQHLVSL